MRSSRNAPPKVDRLVTDAQNGKHLTRARCLRAYERFAGDLDSDDAEPEILAGAILNAESLWSIGELRRMYGETHKG